MKELNDKDFDQAFRNRISEELPDFEEESWVKMEKKLRKRDRVVFFRYASIIIVLLSFGLIFYVSSRKAGEKSDPVFVSNTHNSQKSEPTDGSSSVKNASKNLSKTIIPNENLTAQIDRKAQLATASKSGRTSTENKIDIFKAANTSTLRHSEKQKVGKGINEEKNFSTAQLIQKSAIDSITTINRENKSNIAALANTQQIEKVPTADVTVLPDNQNNPTLTDVSAETQPKDIKKKRKIPLSLAISAGPDFSSTSSLVGGKSSYSFGLSFGVGLTKKLSAQTGLAYGLKNYNANSANYTFGNPAAAATIGEINAACKVLEVPLLLSYTVSNKLKRSFSLNAGLSSYFMLKETYVYTYTSATKFYAIGSQRTTEYDNENRHILSVVNLSATYTLKLNKKFGFGIEPYVKIPLSGIGEGSVPLKSSGVSLKLSYDFNKN